MTALTIALSTITVFMGLYLQRLHAKDHDYCGFDLCAHRAGLPGVELLGLPRAHRT
jgi:hypothetical protein